MAECARAEADWFIASPLSGSGAGTGGEFAKRAQRLGRWETCAVSLFERRAAHNEALFRSVNEEIEKLGLAQARADGRLVGFVCECSDVECHEALQLTVPEYEEVRSRSRWFAIVPGHVDERIEHVVSEHERYAVVEKDTATSAKIADEADPRD